MSEEKAFLSLLLIALFCLFRSTGNCGQYITEDAETTPYEHVEFNPYVFETKIKAWKIFEGPSAEMNVGLGSNLQGHLITPVYLFTPRHGKSHYGYGDIEMGVKYRFIQETETIPQIAFYPKVTLPSGDRHQGTGLGEATETSALWFLKNCGPWRISGGGGYTFNQAHHTFNFPFGGILLQRQVMKNVTLGGEVYGQGKTLPEYRATGIFTFGGNYNFTKDFAFLLSVGHSFAGQKSLVGYVGFDWTWGPS